MSWPFGHRSLAAERLLRCCWRGDDVLCTPWCEGRRVRGAHPTRAEKINRTYVRISLPMPEVITHEMGLTPADFFHTLPQALGEQPFRISGSVVTLSKEQCRLTIQLVPQAERRLGRLFLPVTQVRLEFDGYTPEEINRFMERFWRYFHRGGG